MSLSVSPVFDKVTGHYYGLTTPQWSALAALPVKLVGSGHLPVFAPPAGTLKALARRGVAELRGDGWHRTELGERLWEAR